MNTTQKNYYNEFDPFAAQWLRNLISKGLIPAGDVDTRSIVEVKPDDLRGYTQCHFFAGIGGWSRALELAGWPTDRPVWTGSCPCQPFSTAGRQKGKSDDRHLWPVWFRLIRECRPPVIFGEQVAAAIGSKGVKSGENLQDLLKKEAIIELLQQDYFGEDLLPVRLQAMRNSDKNSVQTGAQRTVPKTTTGLEEEQPRRASSGDGCNKSEEERHTLFNNSGVGAREDRSRGLRADRYPVQYDSEQELGQPLSGSNHASRRIYSGEHASSSVLSECDDEQLGRTENHRNGKRYSQSASEKIGDAARSARSELERASPSGWLDEVAHDLEREGYAIGSAVLPACSVGAPHKRDRLWFVADTECIGRPGSRSMGEPIGTTQSGTWQTDQPIDDCAGHFSNEHWIDCPDGKQRIVKPGVRLLANGVQNRVGKLRGYGNAIVPQCGAEFIGAYMSLDATV